MFCVGDGKSEISYHFKENLLLHFKSYSNGFKIIQFIAVITATENINQPAVRSIT